MTAHLLLQVALGWAAGIVTGAVIWAAVLTGRRRQGRRDRIDHLNRMHAAGQITDQGVDRLRAAIRDHRNPPEHVNPQTTPDTAPHEYDQRHDQQS
jgi:hypothetical protein